MSESERLRTIVDLFVPPMRRAAAQFVAHPKVRQLYPEFLLASYGVVRASVPLMKAALVRAGQLAPDDAVAAGLLNYLPAHIEEELGHDEWALEDLGRLGIDRSAVKSRPASATIAALVGAQYYWIQHEHPVALMGYMGVLEGNPPTRASIDELISRTGYQEPAFRTLIAHAENDPEHMNDLEQTLDRLPCSPAQSALVGLSAMHTVVALTRVFEEIVRTAGEVHQQPLLA
jgi:hypothetical protein